MRATEVKFKGYGHTTIMKAFEEKLKELMLEYEVKGTSIFVLTPTHELTRLREHYE